MLAWAAQSATQTTAVVLRDLERTKTSSRSRFRVTWSPWPVDGKRVAVGLDEPHTYRPQHDSLGGWSGRRWFNWSTHRSTRPSWPEARSIDAAGRIVSARPPASADRYAASAAFTITARLAAIYQRRRRLHRLLPPPVLTSPPSGAVPTAECYKGSASLSSNLGFAATVISCLQTVMVWRDLLPVVPLKMERPVARMAVSPDGNYLALAYVDGGITLHHTSLPSRSALLAGPGDDITALAFDKHAARLAAARADGSVSIFPSAVLNCVRRRSNLWAPCNPRPTNVCVCSAHRTNVKRSAHGA